MELTTEYCFGDFTLEVLAVSKFATENSDSDGSSSSSDSSEEVDDFGSSATEQEEESQGEYDQDAQARDRSSVDSPTKPKVEFCAQSCVRTRKMKSEEKKNGSDEWSWVWETDLLPWA